MFGPILKPPKTPTPVGDEKCDKEVKLVEKLPGLPAVLLKNPPLPPLPVAKLPKLDADPELP